MRTLKLLTAMLLVIASTRAALATPPPGTVLSRQISHSVSTKDAVVGQAVAITHVTSPGANVHNATMYGTVTKVVRAGQGRPAQLRITVSRLTLPTGETYNVDGVVTGIKAVTKSNALKEAGGAVAGMIVGNIIGKTVFHTSGGGLAGAAGGYLLAKNSRENMTVPEGSNVTVKLVTARRQAER
jgi:hypothetical protein